MRHQVSIAALLLLLPVLTQAQTTPKPILPPVEAQIKALVLHAQPQASFGSGTEIFYGQYRTANHVFQTREQSRRHQMPLVELGPLQRGFYLQLEVIPGKGAAAVTTTPPGSTHPWTTVTSLYPLPSGDKMISMTWEAAHGAPSGLTSKIQSLLKRYVATLKS
jgi:hypothetical protein